MNLLVQDKYRTKIMEHLLHQSSTEQQNSPQSLQKLSSPHNTQSNSQRYNNTKNNYFEKVSKQKPLIQDEQVTQRLTQTSFIKNKSVNSSKYKENITQNKSNKYSSRDSSNNKIHQNMPEMRIKGHLKKQSLIFHQKLPIMQISKTQTNIMSKLNKNIKIKQKQQNKGKQNIPQNSIQNVENQREKKYRFVVQNKVTQALNMKKTARQNEQKQHNEETNKTEQKKQMHIEVNQFNETKRSKGSRQMLEFLQSARQKLFQNMKINGKDNLFRSLKGQTQRQQRIIHMKQTDKQVNCQNQQIKNQYKNNENNTKSYRNVNSQTKKDEINNFRIEIEVSSQKTIQLQLSLDCDSKKVAKNFIEQNQSQFRSFNQAQIKKLQLLLAQRIRIQVERQRKLQVLRRQTQSHERYKRIIDNRAVNQVLLKSIQSDQKSIKNIKDVNKIQMSKKKKRLQYSHVYLDNIQTHQLNQQEQGEKQTMQQHKNNGQQIIQIANRVISFNPKNDENIQNQNNSLSRQVELSGYLNSPHQLMTYRPQTPSITNYYQPIQNNQQQQSIDTSHFPLTNRNQSHLNNNNINYQLNIQKDQQSFQNHQNTQQIGAAKILSKSRSKLISKKSLQNLSIHQNYHKNNYQLNSINHHQQKHQQIAQQNPSSTPQLLKDSKIQNKLIDNNLNSSQKQCDLKPYPSINTISSQIVTKLGKQNIMNSIKQKQQLKKLKILKQKQHKILQQINQCSFKPKINTLSKSIDENKKKKVKIIQLLQNDTTNNKQGIINNDKQNNSNQQKQKQLQTSFDKILSKLQKQPRFQELYENHKTIQTKKQYIRQKSLQQISFKPEINRISKKIIETKRNSLANSICEEYQTLSHSRKSFNRHQSTRKKPTKRNSVQLLNQTYNQDFTEFTKKRKGLNMSRNIQGLQIGEYLYKQAMKLKKKKQSQQKEKIDNFKPLDKSEKIMMNLKSKKLSEYFDELVEVQRIEEDQDYNFVISPCSFDLSDEKFKNSPLKFLIPLLQELKELDVSLTRQEFIDSGMKLIGFLSQDEKVEFLGLRKNESREIERVSGEPSLNKLSLELIEMKQDYIQDIYHRGLQYKRQIQEKVENDMENKVRRQLEKCTFKPQINMSQYRFGK